MRRTPSLHKRRGQRPRPCPPKLTIANSLYLVSSRAEEREPPSKFEERACVGHSVEAAQQRVCQCASRSEKRRDGVTAGNSLCESANAATPDHARRRQDARVRSRFKNAA